MDREAIPRDSARTGLQNDIKEISYCGTWYRYALHPTRLPMTDKKAYPLRIGTEVLDAVQRWAADELRSVNAQIEFALRDALRKAGRLPPAPPASSTEETR